MYVSDFFLIKQTRRTISQILFCQKTLHVSGIFFAHHQDFYTVHSTLVYFLQFWWQLPSRVRMELRSILTLLGSGHQKLALNLPVPNVQWKTPDDWQRRCPKHVEFYNRIFHPDPAWKLSTKLQEIYQCRITVENSWWWAKEMPETCRVFWQNKIWEIRASCWFY